MELTVEETMLIINALNYQNAIFNRLFEEESRKRIAIINKLQKQKVGKTKIVRDKK